MRGKKPILIAAFALGILGGPFALESARTSVPPIGWDATPFVLVGTVVGILFVLGIQMIRKNPGPAGFALGVFEVISLIFFGAGLSAFGMSVMKYGWLPSGLLFAAIGIGLLIGLTLATILFRWRYRNVL